MSEHATIPGAAAALVGPTLADFESAARRTGTVVDVTPLQSSAFLSGVLGAPVYLKCENLQRTGSYKIRGAYNRLSLLTPDEQARGVVAASAGNHAQGVAWAARELGIAATIFMPVGVALPKLQATRSYGAEVQLVGDVVDETLAAAAEFAERTGAVLIPPFDHADIVAGQGSLGLEILQQLPEVETVVVPIGGGGLIAGVAAAMKLTAAKQGRSIRVIGVQAANSAAYPVSLQRGEPTTVQQLPTISDGIAVGRPGELNFAMIAAGAVDEIVTVSDDETAQALLALLERAKLVVEPAGAVGVAALLAGRIRASGPTVFILSGGNIDPMMMERVISHGLIASERYLKVRIPLPDRPGRLAKVSAILADERANVVEVLHTRFNSGLQFSQVEIELHMETRGPEHAETVLARLRSEGFVPEVVDG